MRAQLEQEDIDILADVLAEKVSVRLSKVTSSVESEKDEVITIEEIAQFLKVKKAQIYAWVNESKYSDSGIPFLKAGKFLRFSKREVLGWMKRNQEASQKI
jgi:excisionase family DNA binding protein